MILDMTIADRKFRSSILVLRWLLLAVYLVFVQTGLLDVDTTALIISASLIFAYDIFHTVLYFTRESEEPLLNAVTRHLDVVTITIALVAIHDVRNPVWSVYFLSIVSLAHILTRKQMLPYVGWVCFNYLGFAAATDVLGYDVSWSYVSVVAVLLMFMGFNASVLAGGEQRLRAVIASVAVTDSLTGLPNRRFFHQAYPVRLDEAIDAKVPLALMLIDVDHFKEINDEHGHPAGDDKLRDVAQAMQATLRVGDMVARYGGDEFIVVAPHAPREAALALAERLRAAAVECSASVSIGVAMFPDDADSQDALIDAADAALYGAKAAGRNCVRATAA